MKVRTKGGPLRIKAHCNQCAGDRNHDVLHTEKIRWSSEQDQIVGWDEYEMLKCLGCDDVKLRKTSWFSEDDGTTETYFPAAIFRPMPPWFTDLQLELSPKEQFVRQLLKEIYVALQNDSPHLATMGVRSLLERVMIAKVGDLGGFGKHLEEFERRGYVSTIQRERLEAVLEAGHAATHRVFKPSTTDVVTIVDIREHVIQTVYLHEGRVRELRKKVPPRSNIRKRRSAQPKPTHSAPL